MFGKVLRCLEFLAEKVLAFSKGSSFFGLEFFGDREKKPGIVVLANDEDLVFSSF